MSALSRKQDFWDTWFDLLVKIVLEKKTLISTGHLYLVTLDCTLYSVATQYLHIECTAASINDNEL